MANIKISELNEATVVNNDDLLVIVDVTNDETKKVKANLVGGNIPIQNTPPIEPQEDDLWIDTSDSAGGSYLLNTIFPVGSIVIKADDNNYSNWLGFTWERTLVGKVAVGLDSNDTDFDTIGETGGSKYMQKHRHNLVTQEDGTFLTFVHGGYPQSPGESGWKLDLTQNTQSGYGYLLDNKTSEVGTGESGNLQPYQVVAYWKRIS